MTIVSRPFVDFVARARVKRLRRRLLAQGNGALGQRAAFQALLARFERTELGRQHGLTARLSYDEFRRRVPLRLSADFRAFAERMAGGASDVLWPGRCANFVYTAGTVDGTPKMLPVTAELAAHFRTTLRDAWLLHAARAGRTTVFHGRHLQTGASTAIVGARGARAGFLEGILRAQLSGWATSHLCGPAAQIAELPDNRAKLDAMVRTEAASDVRLLTGAPGGLVALLQSARAAGVRWPGLECCVHTGAMLGIEEKPLLESAGAGVALHEVYAAAEGIFAAQDLEAGRGLRLLTDAGIFFEFLPARELGADCRAHGAQCVPLTQARIDVDYALVVTTPGGLCRCVVGDTVRFTSLTPPRLLVTGRLQTRLSSFGEQVSERDLTDALLAVCGRNEWEAVHFHVAPYFTRNGPRPQGCHEWWVELRPGTVRTPTGPLLAQELDAELVVNHLDYAGKRRAGHLEAPVVRLVMPGVFTQWSESHPTYGGPGKLARCRNDRLMADQLAGIARFHAGTIPPFGAK